MEFISSSLTPVPVRGLLSLTLPLSSARLTRDPTVQPTVAASRSLMCSFLTSPFSRFSLKRRFGRHPLSTAGIFRRRLLVIYPYYGDI